MKYFILLFLLASCSSNDTTMEDELAFDDGGFNLDEEEMSIDDISVNADPNFVDLSAENQTDQALEQDPQVTDVDLAGAIPDTYYSTYTVEEGDTLMLVSFKIYGDYLNWRNLKQVNPQLTSLDLEPGTTLNYEKPTTTFEWARNGNPHLIKWGETLGSISNLVYGKKQRWPEIFDNNRPMIKDPNLIFAGFTLYYVPDNM